MATQDPLISLLDETFDEFNENVFSKLFLVDVMPFCEYFFNFKGRYRELTPTNSEACPSQLARRTVQAHGTSAQVQAVLYHGQDVRASYVDHC